MAKERGARRTIWVPENLDKIIEQARGKLGMSRSGFYKYATIRLLQELSLLTETMHEKKEAAQSE